MPKSRPRTFRRHLLAVCTFLVPLGVLAFLGQSELGRQATQARSAIEREALQFLRRVQQAVDQQFDSVVPDACRDSQALLADHPPATAARLLRGKGYGALLDIVLLDDQARLRYPLPVGMRTGLPFAESRLRADDSDDPLQLCDLLLTRGRFADAERHLRAALAQTASAQDNNRPRRSADARELQVMLTFRLATVQLRLGESTQAVAGLHQVLEEIADMRAPGPRGRLDPNALACGVLAELALAEHDEAPNAARLALLRAIAEGRDDPLSDARLLRAVAERAAAGVPAGARERADVDAALDDVATHLRTRAFAADYSSLQQERVRGRLHPLANNDDGSGDSESRIEVPIGSDGSLLVLRRARADERDSAAWIGLRFDLAQLLAGVIERFVRGDGSFVLALTDGEDQPVIAAPPAPADFTPLMLVSHGLQLRAYPADLKRYTADAEAAARNALLLTVGLFVVASVGALWLWRSVSRESELLALKVDLVSRVSHELKTPLALISLYGETLGLKRARDADQAAHFGNIITREAERLTTMIQRVLDFSRREADTLRYEPEATDLRAALEEVATAYAPHLQARGAELTTDLAGDLVVAVDRAALRSVIVNLLENAVKYAREEDPDLSLRLETRARDGMAEIDVLDRGRGVPERERERVFESFYRGSNAGEVRGVGLGLSLVRHFADAHGGSAQVLSRPGGGSIFRIRLPRQPSQQ